MQFKFFELKIYVGFEIKIPLSLMSPSYERLNGNITKDMDPIYTHTM